MLDDEDGLQLEEEYAVIYPRTLAGLFQLADALDTDLRRANELMTDYVQTLPSESKRHWEVCRLVSSFYPKYDENKIVLRATYKDDLERELLEWKVDHLIDEYENIRSILNSEPYKLDISDIVCEAKHEYHHGEKILISGMDRLIIAGKERSLDQAKHELAFLSDSKVTITFDVNESGDIHAIVRTETRLTHYPPALSRLHWVQSYDTPCEWDWSKTPVAYDKKQNLEVRSVEDRNTFKSFRIFLPTNIRTNEPYSYSYEWSWPRFFPSSEEYYFSQDIVPEVVFIVRLPESWELEKMFCRETEARERGQVIKKDPDEVRHDKVRRKKVYVYNVRKSHDESTVEIRWRVKMGGAGK